MTDCYAVWLALILLSLVLLASLCVNVIFCFLRQRRSSCKDQNSCWCLDTYKQGLAQDEEHYGDTNNHAPQENPQSCRVQQENPIYGNISTDRTGSVVIYEAMTGVGARSRIKASEPDLNYASLDLKVAMKRKRKPCHQQGQAPGRNNSLDQFPVCLTPPENTFLEDVDVCVLNRDNSPMVSHSSIYLNSQQIAQESQEMERENNGKTVWQETEGESTGWKREQESEDRVNVEECSSGSRIYADEQVIQSGTDHFIKCPDGDVGEC